MKRFPALIALLLLAALTGTESALAAQARQRLILFIAHADVPPYYIDEPGQPGKGILPDILRAITESLDMTFTVRRLPDKRGWDMLRKGDVDVYASAREWVLEPDRFLWTEPFMVNEDVFLYLADSTLTFRHPLDLYGKRVAGIKGFVYPALESHFGPGRIERIDAPSPDALLQLLILNRADAILINRTEIEWMFHNRKDLNPDLFRMDPNPVDLAWFRFIFPRNRDWEPVIEQFNDRIREMRENGALERILDHYR
ncbi:MAG: substrate-binding periplasmic protein [Pseudodesulfovibrio sp.]|uniref:substrate-binding periplasmic protein n=1 Tax=Pseudodesulfovibrio sp. TaxID=2035812 RepID=UPI003D0B52A3